MEKKIDAKTLKEMGARMEARFDEAQAAGFDANVPEGFDETSSDLALAEQEDAFSKEDSDPSPKSKAPKVGNSAKRRW